MRLVRRARSVPVPGRRERGWKHTFCRPSPPSPSPTSPAPTTSATTRLKPAQRARRTGDRTDRGRTDEGENGNERRGRPHTAQHCEEVIEQHQAPTPTSQIPTRRPESFGRPASLSRARSLAIVSSELGPNESLDLLRRVHLLLGAAAFSPPPQGGASLRTPASIAPPP